MAAAEDPTEEELAGLVRDLRAMSDICERLRRGDDLMVRRTMERVAPMLQELLVEVGAEPTFGATPGSPGS